jgi:hypothetical protein
MSDYLTNDAQFNLLSPASKAMEACRINPKLSYRKAAAMFRISKQTVINRDRGLNKSHKEAGKAITRLTMIEEEVIADMALDLYKAGWPLTLTMVKEYAREILQARDVNLLHFPLGKNWHVGFFQRHKNVKKAYSRTLELARYKADSPEIYRHHFELYKATVQQYNVQESDRYNADEKGYAIGVPGRELIVAPASLRRQARSPMDINREWATTIEGGSADGWPLLPFIIFKAKKRDPKWMNILKDRKAVIAISENGWTNNILGLEWLKQFDLNTEGRRVGIYRLLIVDGHGSHCTRDFYKYCVNHKIILYCLPPHTTHNLQPFDVCVFQPAAKAYKQAVSDRGRFRNKRIEKYNFLQLL